MNLTRGELNALRDVGQRLEEASAALSAAVKLLDAVMGRRNAVTLRAVTTQVALLDTVTELNRQLGDGSGVRRP